MCLIVLFESRRVREEAGFAVLEIEEVAPVIDDGLFL